MRDRVRETKEEGVRQRERVSACVHEIEIEIRR